MPSMCFLTLYQQDLARLYLRLILDIVSSGKKLEPVEIVACVAPNNYSLYTVKCVIDLTKIIYDKEIRMHYMHGISNGMSSKISVSICELVEYNQKFIEEFIKKNK